MRQCHDWLRFNCLSRHWREFYRPLLSVVERGEKGEEGEKNLLSGGWGGGGGGGYWSFTVLKHFSQSRLVCIVSCSSYINTDTVQQFRDSMSRRQGFPQFLETRCTDPDVVWYQHQQRIPRLSEFVQCLHNFILLLLSPQPFQEWTPFSWKTCAEPILFASQSNQMCWCVVLFQVL